MKVKARQEPKKRMHMGAGGSKINIEANSGAKWQHMSTGFHQTGLTREKRKGVKTHRLKEEDGALVACLLLGQAGGFIYIFQLYMSILPVTKNKEERLEKTGVKGMNN